MDQPTLDLPDTERAYFTVPEVAKVLGVSESTVYRWSSEAKRDAQTAGPTFSKIGQRLGVQREDLVAYLRGARIAG